MFGWSGNPERVANFVAQFRVASAMGMSVVILHEGDRPFHFGRKRVDVWWWRGMKNGGLMVLLTHLMTSNWEWSGGRVRLLRQVDSSAGYEGTLQDLLDLIHRARVDATAEVIVSEDLFSEVIRRKSSDADCVVLGFEVPEKGHEDEWFHRYQTIFCDGPTTILVCSNAGEDLMV